MSGPVTARAPHGRLARVGAAVAVALTVVSLSVAPAFGSPAPPPAAAEDTGSVTGSVTAFSPSLLASSSSLFVSTTVANSTGQTLRGARVELAVTDSRLGSADAVDAFLADAASTDMRVVATGPAGAARVGDDGETIPAGTVPPGAEVVATVTASPTALRLPAGTTGVYGVTIWLRVGGARTLVDTTVVAWSDAGAPAIDLAAVATITGPPARVDALMTAADVPGVALLIDPSALLAAQTSAANLRGHEAFRLPARNPDLASLAHSGDAALLEYALRESTRLPTALRDAPWLAISPESDQATLALAARYDARGALAETRYGGAVPVVDGGRNQPVADIPTPDGDVAVLVPNDRLSTILTTHRPTHPTAPARIVAESLLIAQEGGGRAAVVVSTGPSWVVDGSTPSPAIAALFDAPWVRAVSLESVLEGDARGPAQVPEAVTSPADVPPADVIALSSRLSGVETLAAAASSPASVLTPNATAILDAVALAGRADPGARADLIDSTIASVDEVLSAVAVAPGSDVNLVARAGNVPVVVRNDLDVDVTVTVAMTSRSPYLVVEDQPEITIPAQSEATAMVPVTGVSTANVTVSIALRNADGGTVAVAESMRIRVRADWGNAAGVVFTVALVALLVAGIVRTIRRGRPDTRTGPGETVALQDPSAREDRHD